jgi:tetratricopeptide (TPR) repeat protein
MTKFLNNHIKNLLWILFTVILLSCSSTGNGKGLSLSEAIDQSAEEIAEKLSKDSRVAVLSFESSNANFSDYIIEELTVALFKRGIEVVDRQNLDHVYRELNFQMSGVVSDESAKSVGKNLAAQLIITGNLIDLGRIYSYQVNTINLNNDIKGSNEWEIPNNQAMQRMINAMASQKTSIRSLNYGVSEDTTPKTFGALLDRGIMFAGNNEYEKAIADFTEAISLNHDFVIGYMYRGSIYSKMNDFDRAILDYNQAIKLNPNFANLYNGRGCVYKEMNDYSRAIADFTEAIRIEPRLATVYGNRGDTYLSMDDYDRAIADLTEAVILEPKNGIAYAKRGAAYFYRKYYKRAVNDFTQAIRLYPNIDNQAYISRASSYFHMKEYDKAIEDFTYVINLEPNNAWAYYNRGILYYRVDNMDKAITDWEMALSIDPNYLDTKQNIENARKVLALGQTVPKTSTDFGERGAKYFELGAYERVIADFTMIIQLEPRSSEAYNNRGAAYAQKGDLEKAIADWEMALRINPNDAYARRNIERARQEILGGD